MGIAEVKSMARVFSDYGEEWVQDLVTGSGKTFKIGLYADEDGPGEPSNADDITDSSDIDDITTEPSGGAYSAQEDDASNFSPELDGDDNVRIIGSSLQYDVSDSDEGVNAYYVSVEFESDLVGDDSSETEHLMFTAYLDQRYDLEQFDSTVELEPAKLTLS